MGAGVDDIVQQLIAAQQAPSIAPASQPNVPTAPMGSLVAPAAAPQGPKMGSVLNPSAPAPNLLEQARSQYPILKNYDYGYTENFRPNAGYLEHWNSDDPGEAPTSPNSLESLRPQALPMGKPGLEIRNPTTRPIDILGDIVSHHLIDADPVVKQAYQKLQDSITPAQQSVLQDQYQYAQKNEGETGSFDDWKTRAGMPGFLRGYTFQQWPQEFNDKVYTPQQKSDLDGLMGYLKGGSAPQSAQGNQ